MLITILKKMKNFSKKMPAQEALSNFGQKSMYVYCGDYVFLENSPCRKEEKV